MRNLNINSRTILHQNTNNFLTLKHLFHFHGIIREAGLLCNDWHSGCNLMRDNLLTRSETPVPQHRFRDIVIKSRELQGTQFIYRSILQYYTEDYITFTDDIGNWWISKLLLPQYRILAPIVL